MIQRIQSIYLLLGALAVVAMLLVDVIWENPATRTYAWFAPAVLVLDGLSAVAAIGTIFLYKDRKRQLRAIQGVQLLTVLLIAVLFVGLVLAGALPFVTGAGAAGWAGLLLPVVAYVFFYLARRGVQRDIALVRSMDRLR